jgi:type II secretory pathway component GspD/PulD (secretin)
MARELDKAPAQVMIEARIVETTLGKNEQLGIDWNLSVGASGASVPTTFPFPKGSTGGDFRPSVNSSGQISGGTATTPEFQPAQSASE